MAALKMKVTPRSAEIGFWTPLIGAVNPSIYNHLNGIFLEAEIPDFGWRRINKLIENLKWNCHSFWSDNDGLRPGSHVTLKLQGRCKITCFSSLTHFRHVGGAGGPALFGAEKEAPTGIPIHWRWGGGAVGEMPAGSTVFSDEPI